MLIPTWYIYFSEDCHPPPKHTLYSLNDINNQDYSLTRGCSGVDLDCLLKKILGDFHTFYTLILKWKMQLGLKRSEYMDRAADGKFKMRPGCQGKPYL